MLFCQRCGGRTEEREIDGTFRPVCGSCGTVVYQDPKLAVAVVMTRGDSVLLGVRAGHTRNPGAWSFPAGFVERGERVDAAAMREAREETGLSVTLGPLLGVWSEAGEPVVLLAYGAVVPLEHEAEAGDDLDLVQWWPVTALPQMAFAHDSDILAAWLRHPAHQD